MRRERCNRVHSAVTQAVSLSKNVEVNIHAVCERFVSGQLPFLGLSIGQAKTALTLTLSQREREKDKLAKAAE